MDRVLIRVRKINLNIFDKMIGLYDPKINKVWKYYFKDFPLNPEGYTWLKFIKKSYNGTFEVVDTTNGWKTIVTIEPDIGLIEIG